MLRRVVCGLGLALNVWVGESRDDGLGSRVNRASLLLLTALGPQPSSIGSWLTSLGPGLANRGVAQLGPFVEPPNDVAHRSSTRGRREQKGSQQLLRRREPEIRILKTA